MKRLVPSILCLVIIAIAGFADAKQIAARGDPQRPNIADARAEHSFTSTSSRTAPLYKEQAGPDTFALYGGPGVVEGKFSDVNGVIPDRQGWIGFDHTDFPVFWQVSTFNAANLNNNGAGNNAYWSGRSADQVSGWASAPGYGNNWNDVALYESAPLADPSSGQVVSLNFYFNHDTEGGYDYFNVEYDSAGTWVSVLRIDGTNKVAGSFAAPGVLFQDVATRTITYTGGDYSTDGKIKIRLRVTSDGAWSDQDGLWPTDGAAQVDDISINHSGGNFSEDFEGPAPYLFNPDKFPFAGDFSDVYARMTDIDPCRSNSTPVMAFIDRNQILPNGPGLDGSIQTGGSVSPNWDYGFPGGWVVNYNGGLSFGAVDVYNTILSPELDWDLPGTADDSPEIVGARIYWTTWVHLPLQNGIFYLWSVRSRTATGDWTAWRDRNTIYYGGGAPFWGFPIHDVTDLLVQSPEQVQLEIGAIDYSTIFGLPGLDATPSPAFDNVRFVKYRIAGPSITMQSFHRAQDGFPVSGSIAASTQAERDALDIPFDTANEVNTNPAIITAGDSVTVDIAAVIPGTSVTDIRMKWALRKNLYFEDDIRSAPARLKDQNVVATGPIWSGEVVADTTTTSAGAIIQGRFFVDLPDLDLLYPGDELHYYIEATDNEGRVSTLPADISGFGQWDSFGVSTYNRIYRVSGLPTITATGQPPKLIYNDAFGFFVLDAPTSTMGQLGLTEGIDYDVYQVQAPSSLLSNGIGSSGHHGATPDQLAGYDTIIVFWEGLSAALLSDGSGTGQNDKANDIATLQGWKDLAGSRNTVYFGDYVVSGHKSAAGQAYTQTVMGIQFNDVDARDEIGGQTAPRVRGLVPAFATPFVAFGGCPGINQFDSITPLPASFAGHAWVAADGTNYADPVASVVYDRLSGAGDRKVDISFPFGLSFVYRDLSAPGDSLSARSRLFSDVFTYLNVPASGPNVTNAPPVQRAELAIVPNPFNPKTTVEFTVPVRGDATVKVYNLRGELVRTLHTGELDVGQHRLVWDGTDNEGRSVASGVYLVNAITGKFDLTKKAVLVR